MTKIYRLGLYKHEIDNILAVLRYLELHHPASGKYDLKPDFQKLLNRIYKQIEDTDLFEE